MPLSFYLWDSEVNNNDMSRNTMTCWQYDIIRMTDEWHPGKQEVKGNKAKVKCHPGIWHQH